MTDRITAEQRATAVANQLGDEAFRRNRIKPAWGVDVFGALDHLESEIRELRYALNRETPERQRSEAGDVVAMARIVADIVVNR